ncbi:MAG: phosphonate metabolism protein/1,5-bisphosphokinase (PRPP-forming) PhnN [Pseudomonadota bacterium]
MSPDKEAKIGPGGLVLVVGPSGCGKDTLLSGARANLADRSECVFPKRMITRPSDPESEDSIEISRQEFAAMRLSGECCVCWEAHGLGYALPNSIVGDLEAGRIVIFNCSRSVLPNLARRFQNTLVVQLTVPRDVLNARLRARGRETEEDIRERLNRGGFELPSDISSIEIDNSGTRDIGSKVLADAITDFHRSILKQTTTSKSKAHS